MNQAVVTSLERIGQLTHVGEDRIGQRVGFAAIRGSERSGNGQAFITHRRRQAGLPLGVNTAQVLEVGSVEDGISGRGIDDMLSRTVDLMPVGIVVKSTFGRCFEPVSVDTPQLSARIGVDEDFAADGIARIELPDIDARGQLDQFIPVLRPVGIDIPTPVFGFHELEPRRKFDTLVTHAAGVDDHRRSAGRPVGGTLMIWFVVSEL